LSGYFAGTIGRKKVILLSSVMMTAGWAFIGFSDGNYALLMTGRLIHGFAFLASVSQVYLAEISDAKRRGFLATSGTLFVSSGITFVYVLGAVLPWRWVCLVSAVFPAATILLCNFIPETPTWLVHNGKIKEAEQVRT
jgi:MFS family permease